GAGMVSEYANTDLMGAYAGLGDDLSLGLEGLRIGDLVAVADADHRFGRGYPPGFLAIGVISTGQCMLFGHGPGPSSLMSGPGGDGGSVLGVRLGEPGSALAGDHIAPGACLVHPDPAARLALVSYACLGNEVEVRTGRAAGARGAVIGKRGEDGRLITGFRQEDLARMRPGDEVTVRASGQGWQRPGVPPGAAVMN